MPARNIAIAKTPEYILSPAIIVTMTAEVGTIIKLIIEQRITLLHDLFLKLRSFAEIQIDAKTISGDKLIAITNEKDIMPAIRRLSDESVIIFG